MVPFSMSSELYIMDGDSIPALNTSCSRDQNGLLHITLANLNPNQGMEVLCTLKGIRAVKKTSGNIITGPQMNSMNDFGKAEEVSIAPFDGFSKRGNRLQVEMPAMSIVMIELETD